MNGSLKHNGLFKQRMPLEKLESGFGPSCFFLMGALHNRRFLNGKKIMDFNEKSYLPNLKRALIMKNQEHECRDDFENPVVSAFDLYDFELFNFNSSGWISLNEENVDILDFPPVSVVLNQHGIFDELRDNDMYWASVGSYEVKAASKYLNRTSNEDSFFESQLLNPNSELYEALAEIYFNDMPLNVLRMRIPSSHKNQGFNSKGYKVYIFYNKILNFENGNPDSFEIANYAINDEGSIRQHPNYYFKYAFPLSFCSCKSGQRTVGFCAHRMAAIMRFGSDVNYKKKVYRALDSSNFEPL